MTDSFNRSGCEKLQKLFPYLVREQSQVPALFKLVTHILHNPWYRVGGELTMPDVFDKVADGSTVELLMVLVHWKGRKDNDQCTTEFPQGLGGVL
jgi:hypothetical protein